jgi:hypothetical protein
MNARALVSDFVSAIEGIVEIPVLSFDTNETRQLPAVVVGYESAEKHPFLDNEEVRITISVYSNGHLTDNPEGILQTIFETLSTDGFTTSVQLAELTGTSTSETETATIHTANLTIYL